jgi:hypothetical protein
LPELLFNVRITLFIRWKQSCRALSRLGLFRVVTLLIIILFLLAAVYTATGKTQNAIFISCFWASILTFIHIKRNDTTFLRINMTFSRLICSVEYVALSVPLAINLLLQKHILLALSILLWAMGTGFVDVRLQRQRKTLNTRLQQAIPSGMYEWKAGVRQYFFAIIIAWILGLCVSFFVAGVPVALFVIGILMFDFYKTYESWQILLSGQKNADKFLYLKIGQHIMLFSLLVVPLVAAFMIFHPEYWYIPVIEVIILLSVHIYCIVLKYAFYSHDKREVNPALLITGLCIGLIPVTTPVLWLFSICFFYKAKTNLYFYLNDYN